MQNQHNPDTASLFDHTGFIALRETLLDLLDRQAPDTDVGAQLDKLLQYMRQQFAGEERQMLAAQFPPRSAHKAEHDRALADFAGRIARWRRQRDTASLLDFVETGLADWFVKHVNTRDFITARFIAAQRPSQIS